MRILILGSSGYIGRRLLQALNRTSWAIPIGASRKTSTAADGRFLQLDARDALALNAALEDFDAVVNCVAGDPASIAEGARILTQSALAARCPRIIHLSTMSVYGPAEGLVNEQSPLDPGLGWYGRAKCEAEQHMADFVHDGGHAVVVRPGCVYGPGSELWVGRVGRWRSGRLGDLGAAGDGWSNLVHVDDVCQAIIAALLLPVEAGALPTFNLAAPDSPRWNEYFVDLALAIQATPVRRLSPRQLRLDALLAGPPLKIAQMARQRLGWQRPALPDPMPPALVRFWGQQIRLDASAASRLLQLKWTSYQSGLRSSSEWFSQQMEAGGQMLYKTA